jgi:chlorobactene glucosyltransferase
LVTIGILWVLWNFSRNLKDLIPLENFRDFPISREPLISVLVPARNEERNIRRCIESLLSQDYQNLEIIVLDDQSTDRTGEILKELQGKYSGNRLKIIEGKHLPQGWLGKNFACHQLSQEAEGDFLLFVDADTWLSPDAVRAGLSALEKTKSDFLSLFPGEVTGTIWERMVVPFLHFAPMCFLPMSLIRKSPNPLISIAIGQFMMFRRSAYRGIGGHAGVKSEVVEDIALSRRIKEFGFSPLFLDGGSMVSCRMYRNFKEVWLGFSKIIFAVFKFRLIPLLVAMSLFDALFLFPFFYLLRLFFHPGYPEVVNLMILLQISAIFLLRMIHSYRFKNPGGAVLHPFSVINLNLIALFSAYLHVSGKGVIWKGRKYRTVAEDDFPLDAEEEEESLPSDLKG